MNEAVSLPEPEVALASPGAQLAAAREMSGLSITDIARQLKLSPWQVEALESGDYRRLPGAVFVRGFIRNYARVVSSMRRRCWRIRTRGRRVPLPALWQ